ncbi:MAG: FGGY family carbohydrate kinase [Puniceicoccaceae bacterium]
MPCFLSIDQSTSATKAILLDGNASVLARASKEHGQSYPQPGYVEQDAGEIYANTLAVLEEAAAQCNDPSGVRCLSISNQRETVVVFSRETGEPLYPAIVWQCRRGTDACQKLKESGAEPDVHQRTGLTLDPYFSASKLQVLIEANPGLTQQLEEGRALVGTIDTYLIYRLTRGRVFATDHTNACRTLLYNITERDWDDHLCDLWGVPRKALAEIRDCDATFGEVADCEPLNGTPICGVMGDSHASLFAQRCFSPGMTKVTLGTGSSILMNIGEAASLSDNGVLTTLGWVRSNKATYALEGIIVSSASTLAWLKSQLGILADAAESESLATEIDDNGGVYLVPAFTGLGLPHWDPNARALITGLSSHSDRRHVVRAALEAIAYQLKDALDAMAASSSLELKAVHADGGPTANRFLMQFIADMTQIPVRVSSVADGSPLGSALMGMIGTGTIADLESLPEPAGNEPVYSPAMDDQQKQKLYAGWSSAIRQALLH